MKKEKFLSGCKDAIPIALGYLAVGFSLGFAAKNAGLTAFQGFLASFFTYASAGEYAAFSVIAANSPYIEMALVIFVTNCRYLLMSCALSQRVEPSSSTLKRVLMGGFVTDEIFGASIGQKGFISPFYTYGLASVAIPSWSFGTMLGVLMGNLLPVKVAAAFSVTLYGMFIAVIIPESRKNKKVLSLVLLSFLSSYIFEKLPVLGKLDQGFQIIILTVILAALFAFMYPVEETE